MKQAENLLSVKNISKSFPGVEALKDVSLDIRRGEVVALVGENGAGKSTLIKILAGAYNKDAGSIFFEGNEVDVSSPVVSQKLGISVIFQELNLLPNLSVAENLFVGREWRNLRFIYDDQKTVLESVRLMKMVGLDCSPTTLVGDLSLSKRQMIEIAKALSLDAKLIIMDEPTSALTDKEIDILFEIIEKLKKQHVSVIFVSHKIDEVQRIADRVHVLRDGEYIGGLEKEGITEERIIQMMVGRKLADIFDKKEAKIGGAILEVRNLSTQGLLKNLSFSVREGEIIGFAGLVGAGRTEVMRAIFGVDEKSSGEIVINKQLVEIQTPKDAIKVGIGFIPEDRKIEGLILEMNVKENISLAALEKISKSYLLLENAEENLAIEFVDRLKIKTPGLMQLCSNLSGGNQQKVVLAKWLATTPRILIMDEPTRGIDVGAKKEIHALMSQLAENGVGIIMISSELPEILGMSDRIVVMHDGMIKGELSRKEASQEKILELALMEN